MAEKEGLASNQGLQLEPSSHRILDVAFCFSNVALKSYWLLCGNYATTRRSSWKVNWQQRKFIPATAINFPLHTCVSPPSRMSDMDTDDLLGDQSRSHSRTAHSHSRSRTARSRSCSRTARSRPRPRNRRWRNRRRQGQGQVRAFLPAGARASARTAGPKIALRFSRLFVCLCVRTYHVRNILHHTLLCNCMQCIAALEVCRPSYSKLR